MKIGGKNINNWYIVGGVAGIGVIYYIRRQNSAASSTSSTSSSAIDPVTGLPYSEDNATDPLTGMTYLQEAQQYGSVQAAEAAMANSSQYAYGGSYSGGGIIDSGYPTTASYAGAPNQTTPTISYSSNAAWSQAAQQYLTQTVGLDSATVSAALGTYITGGALTSAQVAIVDQAIASEGYPPQQGPQGMPPGLNTGPVTSTGTTTTPPPATTSTTVEQYPAPQVSVVAKTSTSVTLRWENTNPPASSFTVRAWQMNGKQVYMGTVAVPDTTGGQGETTINGLHAGWQYKIQVWANGGQKAPPGATVIVTLP